MTENALAIPTVLDQLERAITIGSDLETLSQVLRALQRLGLTRESLVVRVERRRAINDATAQDETVEDRCITALEVISGSTRFGLTWDATAQASAWVPRVLTEDAIAKALPHALAASDLLPPRPPWPNMDKQSGRLIRTQMTLLEDLRYQPTSADLFRSPRSGLTSRPACLLAPADRIAYEALAEMLASRLSENAPPEVLWPRDRSPHGDYEAFTGSPAAWDSAYVVRTDISSYYENIDHSTLAVLVTSTLKMSSGYSLALEALLDAVMASPSGIPQGPPGSELLGSAYLVDVDRELSRRGWPFARYADDILLGASTIGQARARIRDLETLLRERGLQLSSEKTKVLRRDTYLRTLGGPSAKVADFRGEVRDELANWLEEQGDSVAEATLIGLGFNAQLLWDLLYHRSVTLSEALEQVGGAMHPGWGQAYERILSKEARRLAAGGHPGDVDLSMRDLRECLLVMTGGKIVTDFGALHAILDWHPTLVRDIAGYLDAVAEVAADRVQDFLRTRWQSDQDSDLETAWLLVPTTVNQRLAEPLLDMLESAARSDGKPLSRMAAVRSLANLGALTDDVWRTAVLSSTSALRAEMLLAKDAAPNLYPADPPDTRSIGR